MSTIDSLLDKAFLKSKNPKELTFLSQVFKCIDRKNPSFLAQPGVSKQVTSLCHKYINDAKNREIKRSLDGKNNDKFGKKSKSKTTPKPKPKPKTKTTSTSTSTSTSTTTSKSISTSTNESDEKETSEKIKSLKIKNSDKKHPVINEPSNDGPVPLENGGKTDKYVWTQTLSELDIHFEVPAHLRGKHFIVQIKNKHLKVGIKGDKQLIVNGELEEEVMADECAWTLDKDKYKNTKTLTINLQKKNGMTWWKRVLVGDPEINTKNIVPENSKLDDLDPETRQTVAKMMFDQRQKMMGKPTSKEIEQKDILEKFKRQHPEMNFDNVKFGNNMNFGKN